MKRLNRAQEKVLQKLGKADETKDEQFEQVVVNFRRQESEGTRLQREMKAYMAAIKGMQQASINLTQSLHEVYEPDWHGKDDVMVIGKDCDAMWEDFHNKLVDSTLLNLDEYLLQFPDLKTRVAKRSRKLIDYDSARHHMETLQVAGMKNDRKAEEELKKAQKVFDELNVGLQDELPTLWDSRVGFYISTFKSVTKLEAKFHREISLVCRQLYEVMTKLAEQHSDKMFTIQGAPSDSGPLRLARTPSPPDSESPPDSPDASYNHTLRPVSPGPPRPKSPIQLKKGPPVPPPPKVTPTKEVAEEQIIDLFGGEFLPAPSPSQPNERPGQSLLDMDFDAFQPDDSVSPIPQVSLHYLTAEKQFQPEYTGFVADWSADFGSLSANGDAAAVAEAPAVGPEGAVGGAQDWAQDGVQDGEQADTWQDGAQADGWQDGAQADGWQPAADTATPLQDREAATTSEDEVRGWNSETNSNVHPSAFRGDEDETGQANSEGDAAGQEDRRKSTPGLIFTNEYGEEIEHKLNAVCPLQEKMPIPSVVIEPASSNEGDDDRDADIISPTAISDNGVTAIKHMSPSGGVMGLPDDFLYKVETMHDFEAANSDELELNRGDVVLVVPTASIEDQEAGWLTGFKESEWLTLGTGAHKGLFPENFTQRLE
uniref:Amphiphysin n=1 Tax=Sander lucioperca TaxID=283035 RepID=A0A8C9XLK1_SANLU